MKSNDRRDQILVELRKKDSISLEELMKHLGASPASIRRDLAQLQHRGLIRRTHGGAVLIEPLLYEPFRYDSLFQRAFSIVPGRNAASALPLRS